MRLKETHYYHKYVDFMLTFMTVLTMMLFFVERFIDWDNFIYAIGEIGTYDNSLFQNNVFWETGVISPRYLIDYVFSAIMHLNGGNWAGAALIWLYFGAIVQSLGITNIVIRLVDKYHIFYAILLSCLFAYNDNSLGGYNIMSLGSTSVGAAVAFSILSVSFLFGKRDYNLAWVFAGCSAICHIHEGIYCATVIFIFALTDFVLAKKPLFKENRTILFTIVCLGLVTVPSFMTDRMDITNEEFVYIYSIFRHPHHLVPTTWGWGTILTSGLINICVIALCVEISYFLNYKKSKEMMIQGILLMIAWCGAILLAYIFTEIIPIALFSTMFLSKAFKYVLLVTMIWVVQCVYWAEESQLFMMGFPLIILALFSSNLSGVQITILFISVAIAIMFAYSANIKLNLPNGVKEMINYVMILIIIVTAAISRKIGVGMLVIIMTGFVIAAGLDILQKCQVKQRTVKLAISCSCVVLLLTALYGDLFWREGRRIVWNSGEKAFISAIGNDLYELAGKFKSKSQKNTEFLADPDDAIGSGGFQVAAERNCYVINKVIPSSRCRVDDWYERYMETREFGNREISDIVEVMDKSDIEYVLVRDSDYKKFAESGRFDRFLTCEGDSYRVYRLRR